MTLIIFCLTYNVLCVILEIVKAMQTQNKRKERESDCMYYEVIAQFAKAGAPSFYTPGYEAYLIKAKEYFNMRSRVATNPKEIIELSIVDAETIRIIFTSQMKLKLSQISRSLRVFSMFLVDETHKPLNFSSLVSGRRLFRMSGAVYTGKHTEQLPVSECEHEAGVDDLLLLKQVINVLEASESNTAARDARNAIEKVLDDYVQRGGTV